MPEKLEKRESLAMGMLEAFATKNPMSITLKAIEIIRVKGNIEPESSVDLLMKLVESNTLLFNSYGDGQFGASVLYSGYSADITIGGNHIQLSFSLPSKPIPLGYSIQKDNRGNILISGPGIDTGRD